VNRLSFQHRAQVFDLLRMDAPTNIYLLALLEQAQRSNPSALVTDGEIFGGPSPRHMDRIVYVSRHGLMVPFSLDSEHAFGMGDFFRDRVTPRMVVGPREICDAFWRGLKLRQDARISRDHQLYTLHSKQLTPSEDAPVQRATRSDLERCCVAAAEMQLEELGVNPMTVDPERFRKRVATLIEHEAIYFLEHGMQIGFQASADSRCVEGVQVQGVITPKELRGRGLASRGLAGMCRLLFEDYPLVTLHVNEENTGAIRLYERLGFVPYTAFRLYSF